MNEQRPTDGHLQIEEQVYRLQQVADPAARAAAMELVASVLELHGLALQKMLGLLRQSSSNSEALAAFERDDLVRAVLLLHDLHPRPLADRVRQAIEDVRPRVEKYGATVELIHADSDGIKAVVRGARSGCGSTSEALQAMVEAALIGAAPDAVEITVDISGRDSSFIAIDSIQMVSTRVNS